jgi:hypothetical protein
VLCEFPRSVNCDQALRIDEVDAALCFFLRQALECEETHHLLRDTDARRTSSQEEDAVVGEGSSGLMARQFGGIEETGQYDLFRRRSGEASSNVIKGHYSTSSLNIIIEYRHLCTFLVFLEVVEGMLGREVFKLDKDFREDFHHSLHEFIHESIHFSVPDSLLSKAEVERICQVLGIVGTELMGGKFLVLTQGGNNFSHRDKRARSILVANQRRQYKVKACQSKSALSEENWAQLGEGGHEYLLPLTPKSPRPRIRDPSVTTVIRVCWALGQFLRTFLIFPLSSILTYCRSCQ